MAWEELGWLRQLFLNKAREMLVRPPRPVHLAVGASAENQPGISLKSIGIQPEIHWNSTTDLS